MKYPRVWEGINDDRYAGCARLRVWSGWIVVSWCNKVPTHLPRPAEPLLFISDPEHKWELEEVK